MNEIFKYGVSTIFMILALSSCDGITGEEGVVENKLTGERLEGVNIVLKSHYDEIESVTNQVGYFQVFDSYSCGIKKCDDTYKMVFEKEGFVSFSIDQNYYWSSEAKFVNNETKDTLLIELNPILK